MIRRNNEAAERAKRRQEAEDDAPRLAAEIPSLATLRMVIAYRRGEIPVADSAHVKIVMVARAPALFVLPCSNRDCRDGGHDVTSLVMQGLRAGKTKFTGEDQCRGALGSAGTPCTGTGTFEAEATYNS